MISQAVGNKGGKSTDQQAAKQDLLEQYAQKQGEGQQTRFPPIAWDNQLQNRTVEPGISVPCDEPPHARKQYCQSQTGQRARQYLRPGIGNLPPQRLRRQPAAPAQ